MIAPSEKHLEDYIWNHPESLGTFDYPERIADDPIYDFYFRQYAIPSGRIDLVATDYRLCIFELKRGVLTGQSLTQLMRYMRDVRLMAEQVVGRMYTDERRDDLYLLWNGTTFDVSQHIAGVLIGYDVEDENLLIACAGCGVEVFLYEYDDPDFYTFYQQDTPYFCYGDDFDRINKLGAGPLGGLLKGLLPDKRRFDASEAAERYLDSIDGGDA